MDKNIIKALKACSLFDDLSETEIEQVMSEVNYSLLKYNKKDIYVSTGEHNSFADIVISGELSVKMDRGSGRCVKIGSYMVGRLSTPAQIFYDKMPLQVTIEAVRPTTLLRITPDSLLKLFNLDHRIQMNFIKLLSSVAITLAKMVKQLTLFTVREKVANYLEEVTQRRNSDTITFDVSRQEIANMFAIQKYSLQRVLGEFAKGGAIKMRGKTITILDREKLRLLANP
jgi:CRP-like cAMP-binding protein